MAKPKPITIIGCGPGGRESFTDEAKSAAQDADCLIGSKRFLKMFDTNGCEKITVVADVGKVVEAIEAATALGKNIGVLVSGDPGLCSLAKPIIKRFGKNACRVVPGISSVQVAFSRIGLDWYGAKIITAHGDDPRIEYGELANEEKIAVLAGRDAAVKWIAGLAEFLGDGFQIIVCENLTLENERVAALSSEELINASVSSSLSSFTVVLIVKKELL